MDVAAVTEGGRRLRIASIVDAAERMGQVAALLMESDERLGFEHLGSDLTAKFANAPYEQVDAILIESLQRIAGFLDVDRNAVWQFTGADDDMVFTHAWFRPGFETAPRSVSTRDMFPWVLSRVRAGEPIWNATLDDAPAAWDRENFRAFGAKSNAILPLVVDGKPVGALSLAALRAERSWSPDVRDRLQLMATVFAGALARRQNQERLLTALATVESLRGQLAHENAQLRQEMGHIPGPHSIAAESATARAMLVRIDQLADTDATVLLLGETGTGKELCAQAIHDWSRRRDRPMVRVNCAAIPAALIENELFGRGRGACTGALSRQIGRFDLAHGSTLFLDEIGDLPLESQVMLLRVTQERVLERLGSTKPIRVDVRLIAATNRDLSRAVAERVFREDLYHRPNVFPITVPPLRERLEDIAVLTWTFVEEFSKSFGKRIDSIHCGSLEALLTANTDDCVTLEERRLWNTFQGFYEGVSRAHNIPVVGPWLWRAYDRLQAIQPHYPFRDLSKPSIGASRLERLIRRGFGGGVTGYSRRREDLPFLTTFYAVALAADHAGRRDVFCVVTDSDINRVWVAANPKRSNVHYLAPTPLSRVRLLQYGVPEERIFVTGFPLPDENPSAAPSDLARRLAVLDTGGIFRAHE